MARAILLKNCVRCGKEFTATSKYFGKKKCDLCKTGRTWLRKDGYIGCRLPNGRAGLQHRMIWEIAHGPINDRMKTIHHINGIKTDNRIENLELINVSAHSRMHNLKSGKTIVMTSEVRKKISESRKATKGKNRSICKIDGCGRFVRGKGYCNKHYIRLRSHGDPMYSRHEHFQSRKSTFDL